MLVLKFGEMNPMTLDLIFGLLDALSMKCAAFILHSKEKIFKDCINSSKKENMKLFHQFIQSNFLIS